MIELAVPTMLTINETIAKLKENGTVLSYSFLRTLCLQNRVVHIHVGESGSGKYLINFESLIEYLNTGDHEEGEN